MIQNLKEIIYKRYNISFSKSGDDIQLFKLINSHKPGLYVDVGCWHPIKASNSYFFHLRKWKGICIDANPELESLYRKYRKNDTFLNCGVGTSNIDLTFHFLNDSYSSMNTFNLDFIKSEGLENQIKKSVEIPVLNLAEILENNIKSSDRIDFFDIDVEGNDLDVLKSNDWVKFRPKIVMVETTQPLRFDFDSKINSYMGNVGYSLIGKSVINGNLGNLFFQDKKK